MGSPFSASASRSRSVDWEIDPAPFQFLKQGVETRLTLEVGDVSHSLSLLPIEL